MKAEFSVMKIKCTPDLIGQYIIIPFSEEGLETINTLPIAEKMTCKLRYSTRHNIERHDLFFSCLKLVSENTGRSENEIREAVKIDCRWIEGYTHYKDKNGNDRVNIITRSIAFSEMTIQEADQFYKQAFTVLAGYLNISTEELITEAKLRMKHKRCCRFCGSPASQKHHKFSQTRWALDKYGKKLINSDFNIEHACADCHSSHNKIPKEYIWTEKKFIDEARKAGYTI